MSEVMKEFDFDFQKQFEIFKAEQKKLMVLFNVTRNITKELDLEKLLMLIMDEVKNILQCDRCTVFLLDEERQELWSRVAHGTREIRFARHLGIAGYVSLTGDVLNIPDAYADNRFNQDIDKRTGYHTRNLLTAPMRNRKGEIIGVFQALNKFAGPFVVDDVEMLDAISNIAATQIENAQLYEELRKTFDSFIETLASTIDARDPLTAGHSRRIALYADEVARVVNLNDQERNLLRTAAILHDFGKIAVREAILTKEGRLTPEEFEHIKGHSSYTRSILEKINFSRELRDVPVIAASHHERVDGTGYPEGLKNGSIHKLGKILAVVDVFDALTSRRHYRDRMEFTKVIEILTAGAGSHFDSFFVEAFKKINLGRLVEILEDDHKNQTAADDIKYLSNFDVAILNNVLNSTHYDIDQIKFVNIFKKYYTRKYIEENNAKN